MGSSAAQHNHAKSLPSRRPFAAAVLSLFVLAVAALKLLPPGSLHQPLDVQQLLQVADCSDASLDGGMAPTPAAAGLSGQRRLRIMMLSHDLTLTGAPQVLYEVATHLQTQGHSIR